MRTDTVADAGEYAVRGGLVDLFPAGEEHALRLDFFGDEIESVRRFDPADQRTIDRIDGFTLLPASEVLLDEDSIKRFRAAYRETFGATATGDPLYQAISEGRRLAGMEHWLPLLRGAARHPVRSSRRRRRDRPRCRRRGLGRGPLRGDRRLSRQPRPRAVGRSGQLPPDRGRARSTSSPAEWADARSPTARSTSPPPSTSPTAPPCSISASMARAISRPSGRRASTSTRRSPSISRACARQKRKVVLASYSIGARERLHGLLADHGLERTALVDSWQEALGADARTGGVALVVVPLDHGFTAPGVAVLTEQDMLGDRLVRRAKRKKSADAFLAELATLSPRRFRRPRRSRHRPLRGADLDPGRHRPRTIASRCSYTRRRQALRAGREYRHPLALRQRERRRPARQARRRRVAGAQGADEGAHPRDRGRTDQDRRRTRAAPRRRRRARSGRLPRLRRSLPLYRDRRSGPRDQRRARRSRQGHADGPAGLRRCRLRQDRGRAARRLRRGDGRDAGGAGLPDHAARAPAPPQFRRALPGLPDAGRPPLAPRPRRRGAQDQGGARRRHARHRHRHPRAPGQGHRVQAPRPRHRRRGAALRRHPQGAAEGAQDQRPHADADRHADPAHAADGDVGPARAVGDPDAAGRSPRGAHLCDAVGSGGAARGAAARALSRRPELLRRPARQGPARHRGVPAQGGARGPLHHRARPDVADRGRGAHVRLLRSQVRGAALDHDRRKRARHPERQHADRPPRRQVRPRPALPAARPRRPRRRRAPTPI